MGDWFSEDEVFPIIASVIEQICISQEFANRYEIVTSLLQDKRIQEITQQAIERSNPPPSPNDVVGNMVDWFSADITKHSPRTTVWEKRFARRRVKIPKKREDGTVVMREVYAYGLPPYVINPDEVESESSDQYREGAVRQVTINAYERNSKARRACIEHYGSTCQVCGFDFERCFGVIGAGFIHVHHLISLAEIQSDYEVDPIKDLRPVCPNCHAMLHRSTPPYSLEALKSLLKENCYQG